MLKSSDLPQKDSSQSGNASVNLKSAKPVLEHPYILTLLHLLKFEHAVQQKYNMVTVTICESNWEVEIKGPVASLKIIQKLLIEEDELDHPTLIERFLENETALQDLKNFIDSAGLYVDIVDTQTKPFLQVGDGAERKETFHDFIFTLVISKECSPLPNRECQQQQKWTNFVKLFDISYTHQQIFVEDTSVTFVCLTSKSQEMDFIVNIINSVIIQLTRDLKPGTHQNESVPHPDQNSMILDESSQSSGNTTSVGGKEIPNFEKIIICTQNSPLLWILNILNLKNSLRQKTNNLDVDIDEDDGEITISGSKDLLQKLKSVLTREDKKLQFTENEKAFLCDPIIQKSMNSCLITHGCCIVLSDDLEMFVARKDGREERFRAFITQFIQFRKCVHFPEKYQNDLAWKRKLQQFEEQNPHHHILINGEEVHLLTIASDDKSDEANSVMEGINKAISDSCLPDDSDMSGEDEDHDFFIKCPKVKNRYLHSFMIKEIHDEYDRWQSCKPKVKFMEDGVWISSSSHDATYEISSKLQDLLSTIKHQTKDYNFPGLSTYLNSTGKGLINKLSDQYRCLIEVPDRDNSHPQHLSLNEEQSSEISQGLAYKVIFLGTANCGRFNIHLVQGDMNDLNLEMKIQLQPSEEVESCEIRSYKSSQDLIIRLPLWSAANENLRSSFHHVISVAFDQAKHLGHNDIAFSTAQLTKLEGRFPPSVIAKGIIEMLYEQTGLNLASSQTENTMVDIYVCNPDNEAVFKAFEFFLKLRRVYVGPPSQFAWNKVCFPDSYTYPDFNHLKSRGCQIEVSSNIPFFLGNNACVFYPINPSLDIDTCPAIKENSSAERSLKSSISDLQYQYPDGLIPGDIAPLEGFPDSRHSFVYCSPNWGMNSDKVIENLLEKCIKKSTHYEVTYIVPPGVQMLSKYPVEYLVQIFFKKLDNIAQSTQLLERKRQLVLLVQDPDYRKAFDQELKKRYPSKEKKVVFQTICGFLWFKEKESSSYKSVPKTITKESSVPRTVITFVSTSYVDNQNAAMELERQLTWLMKENYVTRQLNKQETNIFQNLLQNISSDIPVKCFIKEWYEIESTHKNNKRGHNAPHTDEVKLKSSSLKIDGLCQIYLDEFMIKADLIRDTEKDIKKTESAQGKCTTPLKNSTERPENLVGCEVISKQQKKDSSKPQEKDSSKWQGKDSSKQHEKYTLSEHECASNAVSVQRAN